MPGLARGPDLPGLGWPAVLARQSSPERARIQLEMFAFDGFSSSRQQSLPPRWCAPDILNKQDLRETNPSGKTIKLMRRRERTSPPFVTHTFVTSHLPWVVAASCNGWCRAPRRDPHNRSV